MKEDEKRVHLEKIGRILKEGSSYQIGFLDGVTTAMAAENTKPEEKKAG